MLKANIFLMRVFSKKGFQDNNQKNKKGVKLLINRVILE